MFYIIIIGSFPLPNVFNTPFEECIDFFWIPSAEKLFAHDLVFGTWPWNSGGSLHRLTLLQTLNGARHSPTNKHYCYLLEVGENCFQCNFATTSI